MSVTIRPTNVNTSKPTLPKGIPLDRVQLHQAAQIINTSSSTLYKDEKSKPKIDMVYTPEGVFGIYENHLFVVPLANVVIAFPTPIKSKETKSSE